MARSLAATAPPPGQRRCKLVYVLHPKLDEPHLYFCRGEACPRPGDDLHHYSDKERVRTRQECKTKLPKRLVPFEDRKALVTSEDGDNLEIGFADSASKRYKVKKACVEFLHPDEEIEDAQPAAAVDEKRRDDPRRPPLTEATTPGQSKGSGDAAAVSKAKKPATAFQLYSAEHQSSVKATLGAGVSFGDVSKKLGQDWKFLAPAEEADYEKRAKDAKTACGATNGPAVSAPATRAERVLDLARGSPRKRDAAEATVTSPRNGLLKRPHGAPESSGEPCTAASSSHGELSAHAPQETQQHEAADASNDEAAEDERLALAPVLEPVHAEPPAKRPRTDGSTSTSAGGEDTSPVSAASSEPAMARPAPSPPQLEQTTGQQPPESL